MNPTVLLTTCRQDPDKGFFEKVGDACLYPYHSLFNGKFVNITNQNNDEDTSRVVEQQVTYLQGPLNLNASESLQSKEVSSHPDSVGIAGILVIPGIFFGVIFKGAALMTDPKAQEAHTILANHYRTE